MQKYVTFAEKDHKKFEEDKNYRKVWDHCYYTDKFRGAAHSICNLRFSVPNEIPVFFYTRSNYDYYFIMKKLVNEFKVQFECHGENKEKHKTSSAQKKKKKKKKLQKLIKMVMRILNITTISYKK